MGKTLKDATNMSPIALFFRNKWVLLVLAFNILAIVIVAVLSFVDSNTNAGINFVVAPLDAEIKVDGKGGYNNSGEAYYFAPGTHEVQISRPPLDTKTFKLNLEANSNFTVTAFLSQNGTFDFYNKKENLASYYRLVEIASKDNNRTIDQDSSAESFIESAQRNFELSSEYLPIVDRTPTGFGLEYGVDYEYDTLMISDGRYLDNCENILCLYVTDTSGKKEQYALSVIKKFGFNTDLCQVIYEKVNYE